MTERYWLAGGEKSLPTITLPAFRFVADQSRLLAFLVFWEQAKQICAPLHTRDLAERTVNKPTPQKQDQLSNDIRLFWPSPRTQFDYEAHEPLIEEMTITRLIDNFLSYLSDLLALIYKTRPAMLKSSEQETLGFILQFENMDELRSALAEKRVERLSYLGLNTLHEYLEKQTGFALFTDKNHLKSAAVLVECRNIIVHNRAIIDKPTIRRFPVFSPGLGKRIAFDMNDLDSHRQFIENAVLDIDVRAASKFGLAVTNLPDPPNEFDKGTFAEKVIEVIEIISRQIRSKD